MKKVWATSEDGTIEYVSLTSDLLDSAVELMSKAFFCHENVCVAVGLPQQPEAIAELEELILRAARDGVSVVAVDKNTKKVVGAAINKIMVKQNQGDTYFEDYVKQCKYPSSTAVVQFMIDADATCNLFEHCNVECTMEIMFLGTSPEYRNRGLAKTLCQASIELAKTLKKGENVKQSVHDGVQLDLDPVPSVLSAIFTSFITQKIGQKLGFKVASRVGWEEFSFQGKSFDKLIGNHTPDCTVEFLEL